MGKIKIYFKGMGILSGLIIGAGIFAIPWQVTRSGFAVFLELLVFIVPIMISLHLIYSEIILSTKETHRFIGYVEYYYGKTAKLFIALVMLVVFWGSLLVYLVLSTKFLVFIFPSLNYLLAGIISFLICSLPAFFNLKRVSFLEIISIFIIILISISLFFFGKEKILERIVFFKKAKISIYLSLYGLLLYSLYGLSAVPELVGAIGKKSKKFIKKSIVLGTILPAIVYLFFVVSFFKIFPLGLITKEAISSFSKLNHNFYFIGIILSIFGFITVVTSFWILASNLKNSFYFDFKLNKKIGWFLSTFIPFGLYIIGISNFIKIMSFVGAFGLGIEAIVMIFIYKKIKSRISLFTNIYLWLLIIIFFIGAFLSLFV